MEGSVLTEAGKRRRAEAAARDVAAAMAMAEQQRAGIAAPSTETPSLVAHSDVVTGVKLAVQGEVAATQTALTARRTFGAIYAAIADSAPTAPAAALDALREMALPRAAQLPAPPLRPETARVAVLQVLETQAFPGQLLVLADTTADLWSCDIPGITVGPFPKKPKPVSQRRHTARQRLLPALRVTATWRSMHFVPKDGAGAGAGTVSEAYIVQSMSLLAAEVSVAAMPADPVAAAALAPALTEAHGVWSVGGATLRSVAEAAGFPEATSEARAVVQESYGHEVLSFAFALFAALPRNTTSHATLGLTAAPKRPRDDDVGAGARRLELPPGDVLVLGMGGNSIVDALLALLPAPTRVHVVEVEPAVIAANQLHPTPMSAAAMASGRLQVHRGDALAVLDAGVVAASSCSFAIVDCFDPLAGTMTHAAGLLRRCRETLVPGGVVAVNTHAPVAFDGAPLRPFVDVFGEGAVHAVSINGVSQSLVFAAVADPAAPGPAAPLRAVTHYRRLAECLNDDTVEVVQRGAAGALPLWRPPSWLNPELFLFTEEADVPAAVGTTTGPTEPDSVVRLWHTHCRQPQ